MSSKSYELVNEVEFSMFVYKVHLYDDSTILIEFSNDLYMYDIINYNILQTFENVLLSGSQVIVLDNGDIAINQINMFYTWSASDSSSPKSSSSLSTDYKIMAELLDQYTSTTMIYQTNDLDYYIWDYQTNEILT